MTVLTKKEILELIRDEKINFVPRLDKFQIQGHSVDLRLGLTFLIPKTWEMRPGGRLALKVDPLKDIGRARSFETIELEEGQCFEILPQEYIIVSTLEKIALPRDVMGVLFPRSSVNRRGLSVDLSGIVDAGYEGNLIIPIRNNTRSQVIRLYPGERFCQIVFEELKSSSQARASRYHQKDIIYGSLPERSTGEMRLIRSGKLAELKRRYSL